MRFARMIAIVMLLLQRNRVTGKELAEMFEVSLRTIYRDIAAINASGIPITTFSGAGGGIGIMEQYKIDKGIFTVDDISAMLTGLGIIQNTLSGREIANALAKLKSFISDEQLHEINKKTRQFMFDLSPWIGSDDSHDLIQALKSALEEKRTIAFSYFGHRGTEQLFGIEPHRLVFKGNSWYLQAYLPAKQEYRLFKLRRIFDVHIETDTFINRVLPHPFADFTDKMHNKTFPIKLLIDSSALDRITSTLLTMITVMAF